MKLQRLELFGFKSFADRVRIDFNPGITAIVGPNGCGKSNISDAICWVLGEQRPTLVRGSKMEEVIFNGTSTRKPINLAEVTLHFSNEDGILPIEYSEVAIGRRVFREGDSEYRLNQHSCRLKDIQDLIMGTGIGTHAYSLIQQGMVDSVLSDRTEERRYLFEEAAGVTRYKTRRKATTRKLEATSYDLERVEDIVGEVEKAVRSLKRQVSRAKRFREYTAEETRVDVHVIERESAALTERRQPLEEAYRGLVESEAEQAARLGERESAVETLEFGLIEGRETERAARAESEDLRHQIARREESRLVTGETLKHNAQRQENLTNEDERGAARADQLVERRVDLEIERDAAASRLARVEERLGSDGDSDMDDEHRADLMVERAELNREIETLQDRFTETARAAARHSSLSEGAEERLSALDEEADACRSEAAKAGALVERAATEVALGGEVHEEQMATAAELEERLEGRRNARADLRDRLASERGAGRAAEGRLETLKALDARFEGYGEGARALLEGEAIVDGLLGALPEAIAVTEPRFECALDLYLEILGNGLLTRDRAAAERAADRLEADGGRGDFLVPDFLAAGPEPAIPDAAAAVVVARGSEAMRWTGDEGLGQRLRPLFERLLIVDDRAAGFRCRAALSEVPEAGRYYVIVGLDGTLLEPTGRWRTGGDIGDEGVLARRRQREEAEADALRRDDAVARLVEESDTVGEEIAGLERELREASDAVGAADEQRREAREALVVAQQAVAQETRRLEALTREIKDTSVQRNSAAAASDELGETLAGLESDLERARERRASVAAALDRQEAVRAERLSARHAVELERAEAEAGLRVLDRELEHLSTSEEGLTVDRAARAEERVRIQAADEGLTTEREAIAAEIETLFAELDEIEARVKKAEERVREAETKRSGFESELRGLRRAHEETTEKRHACELTRQDLELRAETLTTHLAETYDEPIETLLLQHPLTESEQSLELEQLRTRLEEVRRRRANLGPVNMLAVEEYERESERLEFLTTQRDDLVQAKRQLEEAIRKINQTAKTLFVETFEKIRENFDVTFQTLFEGGHAGIQLADTDDPLESPIEIVASPRGKRVRNISLLSGGERALTALSLLFAIYQVKPSPFCILDEVDAPLDEANVGRFLQMIRHFSKETQFVIITHNKRTMEEADYLYGITMEEPGVSTLVSVSLDHADHEVEQDAGAGEEVLAAAS